MNLKYLKSYLFFLILIQSINIWGASPECKCHSKNPSMVRMHEIIGFKNCGNCHKKNENLMSPKSSIKDEKLMEKLQTRIKEDKFCIPCHNADGTIKKEIYKKTDVMKISDTYYCAKDRLRFPEEVNLCPKCSGKLLNLNKLMAQAKANPSNSICRQCHLDAEVQEIDAHITFKKEKLGNCLDCHKDHDDCGNCHH
ncbi:hypothetical protein HZA55_10480 [Candidatus Poribacteria bacterium]|nr:hypothetical protein [Candidatus Poribacteria bacterium]